MNRRTGEVLALDKAIAGREALEQGLVPISPDEVGRVMAMTEDERLAWAREQVVRTKLETGATLLQPVGSLMERGLKARAARNRKKRERRARRRG